MSCPSLKCDGTGMEKQTEPEYLCLLEPHGWLWDFVQGCGHQARIPIFRMASDLHLKESWLRLKNAPRILLHWECSVRPGRAIVEDIRAIDPHYDLENRVLILTTAPTGEDVVYFSELGLRRIVHVEKYGKNKPTQEIIRHLTEEHASIQPSDHLWQNLIREFDSDIANQEAPDLVKLESRLEEVAEQTGDHQSARYLDLKAWVLALSGNSEKAIGMWNKALQRNQRYLRAQQSLILFYRRSGRHQEALNMLKRMHEQNKDNISRMATMGELYLEMEDPIKAEHYFISSLDRDSRFEPALNGLAEVRFFQGQFDEARRLLSHSSTADKTATRLNQAGINLVKSSRYKEALEHYKKAQYVLPLQEKSPMLFYNIGLCYLRWGKDAIACEYLNLALAKDPDYEKARKLVQQITARMEKPNLNRA